MKTKFKNSKTKFIMILLITFIFFVIGYFVYGIYDAWFGIEPMGEQELRFQFKIEKVIKSGAESVYLKDLTEFEWDKVCKITPYLDKEEAERRIGFKYDEYYKYHWDMDDSRWGLLFVNSKKRTVITLRILTVKARDARGSIICATRNKAKLVVKHSTDERWGPEVEFKLVEE